MLATGKPTTIAWVSPDGPQHAAGGRRDPWTGRTLSRRSRAPWRLTRRGRQVRAGVGLAAVAVTLGIIFASLGPAHSRTTGSRTTGSTAGSAAGGQPGLAPGALPAVESGLLP